MYDGVGSSVGYIELAVNNVLKGKITPRDVYVLLTINNNGGVVTAFKRSVRRASLEEIIAVKEAVKIAKRNKKKAYDFGIETLRKFHSMLKRKYNNKKFFEKLKKDFEDLWPKDVEFQEKNYKM